jgi:hypothetical protein
MAIRFQHLCSAALMAAVLWPAVARAQDESKIRLRMLPMAGGTERGLLRSRMVPGVAELRVEVRNLAGNQEHILYGDGDEIVRFTTNARGRANVSINLLATGNPEQPTFDPRGEFLTINDGQNDVLAAWVYDSPANDPPRPRIKEVSALTRTGAMQGEVEARYDRLPNGEQRLAISLRDMAPGAYDVVIDDLLVATVTPNSDGFAVVRLLSSPPVQTGYVAPHKFVGVLSFNPRGDEIVVEANGVEQFDGEMEAKIPGL